MSKSMRIIDNIVRARLRNKSQVVYSVTISKKFEYLACVIDSGNRLNDLYQKSKEDFQEEVSRNGLNLNTFDLLVNSEIPFKGTEDFITDEILKKRIAPTSMDFFIKEFVIFDFEEKYGKFNPEENPNAYNAYVENTYSPYDSDGNRKVIGEETYYELKEEQLAFYQKRFKHYLKLVKNKNVK